MALEKAIDTGFGVPAVYWRIVRVDVDLKARTIWVNLEGYASQEMREAGKEAMAQKPITLALPDGAQPEDYTRATIYAYAKTLPDFDGAADA